MSELPVVFCLHALGASGRSFDDIAAQLADRFEVVAIDLPGFGEQSAAVGTTVSEMADHVAAVIGRRLSGRPARWLLLGHSMGGKVASVVAARTLAGGLPLFGLAGVVLLAGSPPTPEPMSEEKRNEMLGWVADGSLDEAAAHSFLEANVGVPLPETAMVAAFSDLRRTTVEGWRAWLQRGSREDWSAEIGVLDLPALVIAGEADGDLGAAAQPGINGACYPRASWRSLPGAGHLLTYERPREVAQAVEDFWADVAGRGPVVPEATSATIASMRTGSRARAALAARAVADDPDYAPRALTARQLVVLRAVADRVVPQDGDPIDLAARVDAQLAAGRRDGWRFAELPADTDAYGLALDALDGLPELPAAGQDALLGTVAAADGPVGGLDADQLAKWFEDACDDLVRAWLAHPASLARIGFDGYAGGGDGLRLQGFTLLAVGEREAWEPVGVTPMRLEGMRTFDETDRVDVVVVGTGAGGAPLLAALAGAGLRVVALEAGANSEPGDHTPDETEATDIIWLDERLSAGETPTAFGLNNSGRGVGGSTLHWGAFCPRPDPRDMLLHQETGLGRDWPMSYAELLPFLVQAESDIGVSGPADYPWDPTRRYALPPVGRNGSADAMLRGCAELGIRATDAPAAVLTEDREQPHWGLRQACVNCGACHQGCRNAAKASMDTTYLPAAVAAGAEIRPNATVHAVERDASGRISAVVYRQAGVDHRQRCSTLVLAAGGIETPRLLLHWGLANGSGHVGRNFMAHGATQVWGTLDTDVRGYRGYPSSVITEDLLRPADADFAGGYLIQSLGAMPQTWAGGLVRGGKLWGRKLMDTLDAYPRSIGVGINAEGLPSQGNRLELAAEVDGLDIPKARVSLTAGQNENAMDNHAQRTMTAILEAAGARDLRVVARTAHTLGTAVMGHDPDDSVVDGFGRSHEIDNLWICDGSVFPSSLPANPALTIMGLSLRTAGQLLNRVAP